MESEIKKEVYLKIFSSGYSITVPKNIRFE